MVVKRVYLFGGIAAAVLIGCSIWVFTKVIPEHKEQKATEQAIAEYYADKLDLYAEENARYEDYEVDVAFLGDSLTDGYDLSQYYPQYVTANRGIGGETTIGLEKRLPISAYELKPKVIVMLIGGNNPDTMFDNYERILAGLRDNLPDTKLVLVSLTAMGRDWAHKNPLAAFNNVKIRQLAVQYDCAYVDLFTPLLDMSSNEIRAEYTSDGVHLTAEGYTVFTREVTPVLNRLLTDED